MKTILITTASALMLTTGGMAVAHVDQAQAASQQSNYSQQGYNYNYNAPTAVLTSLPEYATLAANVNLSTYNAQIVQDSFNERVIILKDANGREQFKSVFVKIQNRLKIVDYKGGMIFNQVIGEATAEETQPTAPETPVETVQSPEYKALAATVDLTGFSEVVVEDNYYNRITLFKDANGYAQYKTILTKRTGFVKVIKM